MKTSSPLWSLSPGHGSTAFLKTGRKIIYAMCLVETCPIYQFTVAHATLPPSVGKIGVVTEHPGQTPHCKRVHWGNVTGDLRALPSFMMSVWGEDPLAKSIIAFNKEAWSLGHGLPCYYVCRRSSTETITILIKSYWPLIPTHPNGAILIRGPLTRSLPAGRVARCLADNTSDLTVE